MARIVLTPSLCAEFLGAQEELTVEAGNIFELVRQLDAMSPGFGDFIGTRVAIAVDGVLTSDWSTPLSPASEVLLVPRIAGG